MNHWVVVGRRATRATVTARRNTREYIPRSHSTRKTSHGPITEHVGITLIATPPSSSSLPTATTAAHGGPPAPLDRPSAHPHGPRPTPTPHPARPSRIRRPRPRRRRLAIRVTCSNPPPRRHGDAPPPPSPHPTRPRPKRTGADERDRGSGNGREGKGGRKRAKSPPIAGRRPVGEADALTPARPHRVPPPRQGPIPGPLRFGRPVPGSSRAGGFFVSLRLQCRTVAASQELVMEQKKARPAEEPARLMCDDALTEVFRRLPARALAACRLVCKSWMSVLTDPHFIHEHLRRGQQKLLLFANDRVIDRSLAMVLSDDNKSMYQLSRPAASQSVFVHNSCNGLLCLGDSTGAVEVLNPTTGESLVLPMPMYTAGSSQFSSCNWHCLGFCPKTREHKVVHFYPGSHIDSFEVRCEIYTIGAGVWRQVGSFRGAPTDRGVHVNGTVYYLTKFRYIASSRINCLNLESEKFDVMTLPPRKSYGGHCSLTEIEGRLCLLVVDGVLEGPPRTMDILMLNSDDKQSWTPRYHFSLPWLMPSCYFTPKHTLFHDRKIWVQLLARNLYCFDPSSGSEELTVAWPELDFPFSTHTFIESIVPLRKDYFIKQIQ